MKVSTKVWKCGAGLALYVPVAAIEKLNIKEGNRLDLTITNPDPNFIHKKREFKKPKEEFREN